MVVVIIMVHERSSIPRETAYEIIRETEKAVLIVYEEVYEGNESLTYVFFVPKSIIENADPRVKKGFFYDKKIALQWKVPMIKMVEEREKAVKIVIEEYSESAFWIPKGIYKANFDESCWKWIKENKLVELEYDEIIEYENAIYSKKHAIFIPNKWIIEIGGRYYAENGKIEWLKSKVKGGRK